MQPGPYGSSPGRQKLGMGSPSSSQSKAAAPPPPPSTPASSAWDFLIPFESVDTSYTTYPSSRDSRELREEEGIPDLEDDYQNEVVKEVLGDQKLVVDGGGNGGVGGGGGMNYAKAVMAEDDINESDGEALYKPVPSPAIESDPRESEVHVLDKKIVGEEGRLEDRGNIGAFTGGRREFWSVSDAMREIQHQFKRASASGSELVKILEVGKLPYQRKNPADKVSSKCCEH